MATTSQARPEEPLQPGHYSYIGSAQNGITSLNYVSTQNIAYVEAVSKSTTTLTQATTTTSATAQKTAMTTTTTITTITSMTNMTTTTTNGNGDGRRMMDDGRRMTDNKRRMQDDDNDDDDNDNNGTDGCVDGDGDGDYYGDGDDDGDYYGDDDGDYYGDGDGDYYGDGDCDAATNTTTTTTTTTNTTTTTISTTTTNTTTTTTTTTTKELSLVEKIVAESKQLAWSSVRRIRPDKTITIETTNYVLAAAVVEAPAPHLLGGSISVAVEGKAAKMTIPTTVLFQLYQAHARVSGEGVLFVVTALKAEAFNTTEILAAPPVGVDMVWESSGESIHVHYVTEPILVTVMSEWPEGYYSCAFWDSDAELWSREGVDTVHAPDGSMQCSTSHLSIFGAAAYEYVAPIVCSQLSLLTTESIENVGKGTWPLSFPAVVLWMLCVSGPVMIVCAIIADCRWRRTYAWKDKFFLVAEEGSDSLPHENKYSARLLEFRDHFEHIYNFFKSPEDSSIADSAPYWMAFHSAIEYRDLRDHIWNRGSWLNVGLLGCPESMKSKLENIIETSHHQYVDFFAESTSFLRKAYIIFLAVQPLLRLRHFSLTRSAILRVTEVAAEVFGSLFLACLSYLLTGEPGILENQAECLAQWEIVRPLLIAMVSTLLSELQLLLVSMLHSRAFRYADQWDARQVRNTVRLWTMEHFLCFLLLICYIAFSVFFIIVYLSNVKSNSHPNLMISWTISLLSTFLVFPLARSIFLAALADSAKHHVRHRIRENMQSLGFQMKLQHVDSKNPLSLGDDLEREEPEEPVKVEPEVMEELTKEKTEEKVPPAEPSSIVVDSSEKGKATPYEVISKTLDNFCIELEADQRSSPDPADPAESPDPLMSEPKGGRLRFLKLMQEPWPKEDASVA